MHKENVKRQFGLRFKTFNQSANWITNRQLIAAHLEAAGPSGGKALELCCGTGVVGRAFKAGNWQVFGIDITPEMAGEAGKYFPTVKGCVESLPFKSNSFDLLVMRQAMFLLDVVKVLNEVKRVLKDSGHFILSQTVPFSEVDTPWLKKVHFFKQAQMIRFYTAEDLKNELIRHGFTIKKYSSLPVKESITQWVSFAPELSPGKREEVCRLIRDAPEEYRKLRDVEVRENQVWESWNWVVFYAGMRTGEN